MRAEIKFKIGFWKNLYLIYLNFIKYAHREKIS